MAKEIVLSPDSDPKSPKYILWKLDEREGVAIRAAIGDKEDKLPLLSTLADMEEDFECYGSRLLNLADETLTLELTLEETHRDRPGLIKLLTMIGGLAALAHGTNLSIYGYAE